MAPQNTYDELPYPGPTVSASHPHRIAAVATLLGVPAPPTEHCKVLELGCGMGTNLLSLALTMPKAQLVGLDSSQRQIEAAVRSRDELGLKNVEFRTADISSGLSDHGLFDYIVCHGVLSWVSPEIRRAILRCYRQGLRSNGVGFLSYNTLPGWHPGLLLRSLILADTARVDGAKAKVAAARQLLQTIDQGLYGGPIGALLRKLVTPLLRARDAYLYHEYLEEYNEPMHFDRVRTELEAAGLRYLAEADICTMNGSGLPRRAVEYLASRGLGIVEVQQHLDLVSYRNFRRSLVTHYSSEPNYAISTDLLANLYVALPRNVRVRQSKISRNTLFRAAGASFRTSSPLLIAAIGELAERRPAEILFKELVELMLLKWPGRDPKRLAATLGAGLLHCWMQSGLIEILAAPFVLSSCTTGRVISSPLARQQAVDCKRVANLRHESVNVTSAERNLLLRLDGEADASAFDVQEPLRSLCDKALLQPIL